MIQDLTKSALSFTWAVSLLTMKQAVGLMRPDQGGEDVFAPVAQAAADQLDDSMKNLYRSGDNIQRRGVDLAFSLINPGAWGNVGMRAGMNGPGDLGGMPPASSQFCHLLSFVNPLRWMNRLMSMQGARNCGPCGGGSAQNGQPL